MDYTVTFAPGEHGAFASKVTTGLHYTNGVAPNMPAAPATPGEPGWSFDGWDKTVATKVTGNITYTAQWTQNSDNNGGGEEDDEVIPPSPRPRPPAIVTPAVPPENTPPPVSSATAVAETENISDFTEPEASDATVSPEEIQFMAALEDAGIPTLGIGPGGVPLFGPKGFENWSLFDLIMTLAALIFAFAMIAIAVRKDRKESKKRSVVLTGILAVIGVIIFLVTQDVSQHMVLFDGWSIVFAVLFIAEIIVTRSSRSQYRSLQ